MFLIDLQSQRPCKRTKDTTLRQGRAKLRTSIRKTHWRYHEQWPSPHTVNSLPSPEADKDDWTAHEEARSDSLQLKGDVSTAGIQRCEENRSKNSEGKNIWEWIKWKLQNTNKIYERIDKNPLVVPSASATVSEVSKQIVSSPSLSNNLRTAHAQMTTGLQTQHPQYMASTRWTQWHRWLRR